MKTQYKLTDFKCDWCGEEKLGQRNFPYYDGWTYIYNLQIKIDDQRVKIRDKHFCCMQCMLSYLGELNG